jgi:hypothetical protein
MPLQFIQVYHLPTTNQLNLYVLYIGPIIDGPYFFQHSDVNPSHNIIWGLVIDENSLSSQGHIQVLYIPIPSL